MAIIRLEHEAFSKRVVQLAKKERTNELNSKFDKNYKFFFKVLSNFDIKRKSLFICMTYNFSNKSFH
jgi:hypothetical protein